jgi:PAS domain S-box-containing protein
MPFFSSGKTKPNDSLSFLPAILQQISGRIMAVDNNLNIVYINEPARKYLQQMEAEIRKELPAFQVSKLMGENIDIFHKKTALQRGMLSSIKEPYTTSITISGQIFNLRAFPLVGENGERLGSAVEWLDPKEMDNAGQVDAIKRSQAVIEFTLDGTILTANENFLKVLDYTLAEIQGKHHSMLTSETYRTSPEYQEFWRKLAKGEYVAGKFQRIGKNGKSVWIQASYNPVFDLKSQPFKVVKYAIDITDQVELIERVQLLIANNLSQISTAVNNADTQVLTVSSAAKQTLSNIQSVASGAEEMDASIKEIAQSMTKSKDAVEEMAVKADSASTATTRLAETSGQMSKIVGLIQDIAARINLLALNATIEAAHAGEAGKGFAVVAAEVKNLASQAASATSQINEQIETVQKMSSNVARSVADMTDSMTHVQDYINVTASAVQEQSAVSQEIAMNIQGTVTAVENISDSIQQIENAIGQVDTATKDTEKAAKEIA